MSRMLVIVVGVSLVVGCKDQVDKTCERAVDIAIRCDVGTFGSAHEVDDRVRDNMLGICRSALTDKGATGTEAKILRVTREYAECKAKADDCDGYLRCEAVLERPD